MPGGLCTVGYDDDGVKSQAWPLVRDGSLVGLETNRETAHYMGEKDDLLIEGRGSYSIDQQCDTGQFGGDAFREVKNGKITRMVSDVNLRTSDE